MCHSLHLWIQRTFYFLSPLCESCFYFCNLDCSYCGHCSNLRWYICRTHFKPFCFCCMLSLLSAERFSFVLTFSDILYLASIRFSIVEIFLLKWNTISTISMVLSLAPVTDLSQSLAMCAGQRQTSSQRFSTLARGDVRVSREEGGEKTGSHRFHYSEWHSRTF